MSNMKHSREPWSLGNIENQAQGGKMQCINSKEHISLGRIWITSNGIDSPKNKANAERIVACVNACEGLSPVYLEGTKLYEVIESLEANLKETQKRLEMQRDETERFEALYRHSTEINSKVVKSNRALEAELHATKEVLETQKIAYETLHQAWETQRDTIIRYQGGTGLESTSEAEQQLEKQRCIFKNLARDLQAIIRSAQFGPTPYAVDINTLQAVFRHHGALPDGN